MKIDIDQERLIAELDALGADFPGGTAGGHSRGLHGSGSARPRIREAALPRSWA